MKAKFKIKNYKLHKDVEVQMEGGNLYFVKGPNGVGKTSFVQAITDLARGTSSNKQKLTFNELSGYVSGTFNLNGADGEVYQVIMDYAQGKQDKFTLVKPDGEKTNKKTEIAEIFKYNEFTVEEFFAWGSTADGRRKQAAIFLNLLSDENQDRIKVIDSLINTNTGTKFIERRDVNRDYNRYEDQLGQMLLNAFEEAVHSKGEQWTDDYDKMLKELEEAKLSNAGQDGTVKNNQLLLERKDAAVEDYDKLENQFNNQIQNHKDEIQRLEKLIAEEKEQMEITEARKAGSLKLAKEKVDNTHKAYTEGYKSTETIDIEPLQQKVDKQKEAIAEYNRICRIVETKAEMTKQFEKTRKDRDKLTDEITELSEERANIISEGISNDGRILINEGELLYRTTEGVLVPFSSQNISYSEAGMIIFELMTRINDKFKIWVIGKASEYDNTRLEQMLEVAKQQNGIIVADMVDRTEEDFKIEVYDETDH